MTKGGLLTTSPNRSPATGSSIEPARTSQSASSRAALNRAKASARSDRSVTTTSSACPSRCSACTPHPVPRSRARSTCGRGVHDARVVEAPPMPSTWFSRSGRRVATSPRSEATHQSTPSEAYGRRSHRATTASPSGSTRPERDGSVDAEGGQRGRGLGDVDRVAEGEQPHQGRARRARGGGHPLGGQRLVAVEGGGGQRAEQLGDARDGVARGDEVGAQGGDEGGVDAGRVRGHRGRAYAVGPRALTHLAPGAAHRSRSTRATSSGREVMPRRA